MRSRQRVAVAGSSGLIGSALSASLQARGDEVLRLVRRPVQAEDEVRWDPDRGLLDPAALRDVDAVVNVAGAGVGDHRWTPSYKRELLRSRVDPTRTLAEAMAALAGEGRGPRRLVNGSAIGAYGDRGDEVLTEDSAPGDGFLAEVVRGWEGATGPAEAAGVSVAHARTGIVLAPDGGAMEPVLRLARLGLGGPLGRGRQWWPWITLVDEVAALLFLVDHGEVRGPVNLTAPSPERQRDVARELGHLLHRPAVLPAPTPALRVVLGEFAQDILSSARVLPRRLTEHGFTFAHPDLPSALHWLLSEGEQAR